MRGIRVLLAWAMTGGMAGCGGSGGGAAAVNEPTPAPKLQISAAAGDSVRAPSGVVHAHRVELRNTGNASARAVVVSVSPDGQALQLPLSCETTGCAQRSDGGVDITEIPVGGSVILRQQVRIKPGYRGTIRNDWQASTSGNSATWRQELTAYVADLAVSVSGPASSPSGASTLTYEVRVTNAGPDEASDVSWDLLPVPGQTWRIDGCTASTGSTCPATLGESMKLARLPAGASLRAHVQVQVGSQDIWSAGIASSVSAAGDPDPSNDAADTGQSSMEHLSMTDLEGRSYRLSIGVNAPLRATANGLDYRAEYAVDVTGQGLLGAYGSVSPRWGRGTVSFWGPIMVLGLDIGGVRKSYLAPRNLVTQLNELEGVTFNVLGSRADANGKPTDAYAGSARFKEGALQLCLPDTPTPFEQCPAARLSRLEAAVVGSEIELVARDKVMRLRAARSGDGPVLVSSMRDATGVSEFWIGLPSGPRHSFGGGMTLTLHEATFESGSGQSLAVLGDLHSDANGNPVMSATPRGLPNVVLLASQTGTLGICGLTAEFSASLQPGLFQGTLRGDWLPGAYENGQFVKERPCFAGTVHHMQTGSFAAFLGMRGGELMGRWMFAGAQY